MDSIKHPAMILSILNSVALLSSIIYFYRKTNAVESVAVNLNNTLRKFFEDFNNMKIKERAEKVDELLAFKSRQIKYRKVIEKKFERTEDELEDIFAKITAILNSLKENGMEVKIAEEVPVQPKARPQQYRRPTPAKRKKRVSFEDEEDEEEDDENDDLDDEEYDRAIDSGRRGRGRRY